jgi:hypothetical protein
MAAATATAEALVPFACEDVGFVLLLSAEEEALVVLLSATDTAAAAAAAAAEPDLGGALAALTSAGKSR